MAENVRHRCTKFSHPAPGICASLVLYTTHINFIFLNMLLLCFCMNEFELKITMLWDVM